MRATAQRNEVAGQASRTAEENRKIVCAYGCTVMSSCGAVRYGGDYDEGRVRRMEYLQG